VTLHAFGLVENPPHPALRADLSPHAGEVIQSSPHSNSRFNCQTANTSPSRGANSVRALAIFFRPEKEGVGNAGCPPHPQPRVRNEKAHELKSLQVHRDHPAFPHANGFTVSFGLSPVTGLSCHRRLQIIIRKLDISVGISGPHDFAVRRITRSSVAPPASIASRTQRP
jgi:hypothetical protein